MITDNYVLFTRICLYKDIEGRLFCDPLWEKDLRLHLVYIENFSLCCPVEYKQDCTGLKDISDIEFIKLFELKKAYGFISVAKTFIPNFLTVKSACKKLTIAHSGGAGWPFPISFYLFFLRFIHSFHWIIVIESSFWMINKNEKKSLRKLFTHSLYSLLLKRCVRSADSRIFTQSYYKEYFLGEDSSRFLINPATWINESNLTSERELIQRLEAKKNLPIKILYPSRLENSKGTNVVIEALEILNQRDVSFKLTIMGNGKLKDQCKLLSEQSYPSFEIEFLEPIDYDNLFFKMISEFDYVLVPIINNEQPRIVFDSYSQGVPIIASDTSGILDITAGDASVFFNTGDPVSLADAIVSVQNNHESLLDKGLNALNRAKGKTHIQMHMDRAEFLEKSISIWHEGKEKNTTK